MRPWLLVCAMVGLAACSGQSADGSEDDGLVTRRCGAGTCEVNAFLFGGTNGTGTFLKDAFGLTKVGWTPIDDPPPPARDHHAMATFDRQVLMFGGWDGGKYLDDTWLWTGQRWTPVPTQPPPARQGHAMAALGRRVVMVGGEGERVDSNVAETWTWDGKAWTLMPASPAPSARSGHAMATLGNKVVLFGGKSLATGQDLDDTWIWDGAKWAVLRIEPPVARHGHAMATLGDKIVMFGGHHTATATAGSAAATQAEAAVAAMSATWVFSGSQWSRIPVQGPPARAGHSMVEFDRRLYLVGGSSGGECLTDAWTWTGERWAPVAAESSPTTPPARCFGAAVTL